MREIDIQPKASQAEVMTALGFAFDSPSYDWPHVTWRGHGLTIDHLKEGDELTLADATTFIINAARCSGADEIRKGVKKLLKL